MFVLVFRFLAAVLMVMAFTAHYWRSQNRERAIQIGVVAVVIVLAMIRIAVLSTVASKFVVRLFVVATCESVCLTRRTNPCHI